MHRAIRIWVWPLLVFSIAGDPSFCCSQSRNAFPTVRHASMAGAVRDLLDNSSEQVGDAASSQRLLLDLGSTLICSISVFS